MIDTDKYEGHTRGPWKSIPYCKSIRDKLLHGGIILASSGIGDGSNYSPFIITDDDVVIWPKDTDGKNVVEYEHGAKGPILHIYYEEMMANTRLTMAAPDLLAEVKRLRGEPELNKCPTCGSSDITIYDSFVDSGSHKVRCEGDGCESRWFEIWRHVGIEMIEGEDNR